MYGGMNNLAWIQNHQLVGSRVLKFTVSDEDVARMQVRVHKIVREYLKFIWRSMTMINWMIGFKIGATLRKPYHFQAHTDSDPRYPLVKRDPLLRYRVLVLVNELVDVLPPLV